MTKLWGFFIYFHAQHNKMPKAKRQRKTRTDAAFVYPQASTSTQETAEASDTNQHSDSDSDSEISTLARKVARYMSKFAEKPTTATPVSVSAAAVANVIGESEPQLSSTQLVDGQFDLPVDAHVQDKIKAKIWANEFVEFKDLLDFDTTMKTKYALAWEDNGDGTPTLSLSQPKSKPIVSHSQWVTAFEIFVAIYAQRFPEHTPRLMKYANNIRRLAHGGHDWMRYDTGFRLMRVNNPIAWNTISWDLWFTCTNRPVQPKVPFRAQPFQANRSTNKCYSFNDRGTCERGWPAQYCQYQHLCSNCGAFHPKIHCNKNKPMVQAFNAKRPQAFTHRKQFTNTSRR